MRTVPLLLVLMLSACGASGGTTADVELEPDAAFTPAELRGTPAPEALTQFRCERREDGRWNASGTVRNEQDASASYQVTVLVGQLSGEEGPAKTTRLSNLAPDTAGEFTIKGIRAQLDDGRCLVNVVRR